MSQVDETYRHLPPPARATAWLVPLFLAERLGLEPTALIELIPWS